MSVSFRPQRTLAFLAPPTLLIGGAAVLALVPGTRDLLSQYPAVRYAPLSLLAGAFLLGVPFRQTRVSGLALLLAVALLATSRDRNSAAARDQVVLLSTVLAPTIAVLLYLTRERGLLTAHAAARLSLTLVATLLVCLLPGRQWLDVAVMSAPRWFAVAEAARLRVPRAGIAALLVCTPLLLIPKRFESPVLGLLLWTSLPPAFFALALRAAPSPSSNAAIATVFMCASALGLVWACLDSAWRHANVDDLTELPGRRPLKHHLASLGSSYTLAIVDIDHFKRINDRHGHEVGDQVLRYVASRLRENRAGKAYRYGGEEFVIVCTRGNYERNVAALEELREAIADKGFVRRGRKRPRRKPSQPRTRGGSRHTVGVTASIGVARNSDRYDSASDVLRAADKALYRAKRAGRNRLSRTRS